MPRPLRIQFPGAVYHMMNRGSGRQAIFADAADAQRFIELLAAIAAQLDWRCYAYCLMTNHYHLVIQTPQPNLSAGMQVFSARYTQAFNRRHGRDGHLFRGRFHAILVERESYLIPLIRYVVLNPVLANLAKDPAAWRWSSYRATAGAAPVPPLLDLSWMIGTYAFSLPQAQEAWRAHIAEGVAEREKVRALEPKLRNRSILGSADFVRQARRRALKGR
ncbi:MAG TPA: transposase [Alphaproteobacteria bacterium]|jgi:REP element-mobilizing transposase RayT